ncbi:hypothetical protein [Mycolicibacterium houstonense]|nr:hypothetical protein [Mycolicibacterium houstonense]
MALTYNGTVLPYLHFDARSRQTSWAEVVTTLVEEVYDKRGVLVEAQ